MQKQIRIDLAFAAALLAMFVLAWAMPAGAQSASSNRIVVPLSHPSQPATVRVSTMNGSIIVSAYSGNQVIITSTGGGEHHHQRPLPPEAEGMHQLNANPGLSADENNNVVTVHTSVFGSDKMTIQVPVNTSLQLHSMNGDQVSVTGVNGDISAEDTNGNVTLTNVSGSIVANAMNGRITAVIHHLDANKPSSFTSMNGTIDLTLPADVHADLRLKSSMGHIYMDDGFPFHETRGPGATTSHSDHGMYRVRVDNAIYGTLNGGGPQLQVQNFNGDIYIHRGK